jgi:long-chain acyl-CoA synthetase
MANTLDEAFHRVCRDVGQSPAVHDLTEGRSYTFAELFHSYLAVGRALQQLGIGPGSTIVSLVGNRSIFFPLTAACLSARTTLIPLGETTDEEAISVIIRSGARAIVTDRMLAVASRDEAAIGDRIRLIALSTVSPARYGESVVLKLTSGSTDVPKAAVAGVDHLVNDGRHVADAMGIGAADVNFACIPLSHSYALGNIVMPLLLQGTAVALRQSFNPGQFPADVEATGATVFPGVPFMFDRLRASQIDRLPAKLRLLITAGARIDPATVRWFHDTLGRKVHSFYGSSETGGIAYDDTDHVAEPLDVGRAMPDTTVEIRHPDHTGAGRVFVSGTAVATGYADERTNDTDSVFADGGFLTGDVGYFDARARLVLTGRVSTLINVAGLKVDPAEVERALMGLPGVAAVRVMAASCDRRGQQLIAFVVADQQMTSVDLRQQCARTLSPHKIPRQFIFLDRFPMDARGKTDRRALAALAAGAQP